ncbi:MAG: hypothetical protein A2388_02075, partial [Candidatus Veblenbacteria bacterium RIFOXYB1_FULL_43_13]
KIPLVNENDEVIGYQDRNVRVGPNQIYRVAALWITNSNGDILLAQRALNKVHNPGKWGPAVAGTVEEGETYESNIIKEAQEELGLLNIKPTLGPKILTKGTEFTHFTQWLTFKIDMPINSLKVNKEEVEQVKWLSRDELKHELSKEPDKFLKSMAQVLSLFGSD